MVIKHMSALYREIFIDCCEIYTEHINALCGQSVKFLNVKPGGAYTRTHHWDLRGLLVHSIQFSHEY
jgi:hypothetical protein